MTDVRTYPNYRKDSLLKTANLCQLNEPLNENPGVGEARLTHTDVPQGGGGSLPHFHGLLTTLHDAQQLLNYSKFVVQLTCVAL